MSKYDEFFSKLGTLSFNVGIGDRRGCDLCHNTCQFDGCVLGHIKYWRCDVALQRGGIR